MSQALGYLMLGIQLPFLLFIAFVLSLAGLPLALWLRHREKLPLLDTLIFGFTLGVILMPLVFFLESLTGILYSPIWIAINWLVVALAGMALLWRDGALTSEYISKSLRFTFPSNPWPAIKAALPGMALLLLLAISVWIRLTSAGTAIFELDPYFYLDGVRQVVYQGHNFANDMTAWVSAGADGSPSNHFGQPLYKYLLASWYSLYNGTTPYSPYTMMDVGSIYPPIFGGLSVFFLYLFFREIYNERAGLLAGGLAAFLPFLLLKGQAGDAQIVPYSIFAVFFFLAMFYMMLKRRSWIWTAMAGLSYGAIVLGSNVEILLVFCLSLLLFGIGVRHILQPDEESRELNRRLLVFLGLMTAVQILSLLSVDTPLHIKDWLVPILSGVGMPAVALLLPLAFDWFAELPERHNREKEGILPPVPATHRNWLQTAWAPIRHAFYQVEVAIRPPLLPVAKIVASVDRFWRAALFVCVLALLALLAPHLPGLSVLVSQYQFWGAYSEPLYRTIAEQAPGASSFDGQFGFVSLTVSSLSYSTPTYLQDILPRFLNDTIVQTGALPASMGHGLSQFPSQLLAVINVIPTDCINGFYNTVAWFLNNVLFTNGQGNFITQDRTNSLTTFFLFLGPLFLFLRWIWQIWDNPKAHWPLAPMLLLAFIVPITFMGFEKQKLLTYLGMALIMAAAATIGEAEIIVRRAATGVFGTGEAESKTASTPFWSDFPFPPRYLVWAVVLMIVLLEMGLFGLSQPWALPLLATSFTPTFQQAPQQVAAQFATLCNQTGEQPICNVAHNLTAVLNDPLAYYDPYLCSRSLWLDPNPAHQPNADFQLANSYRCSFVSQYWLASMQWIEQNVGKNTTIGSGNRVISWWDYGHWINFFGQSNTVLRNEHASRLMIYRTAWAYLDGNVSDLRSTMKMYDSKYALMDIEIIGGGDANSISFGGKYGALNYLGCAFTNATGVNTPVGTSTCETTHLPETVIIPANQASATPCVISQATQASGIVAYRLAYVQTAQGLTQQPQPAYCFTSGLLANGTQSLLSYNLANPDSNGDLTPHYAIWKLQGNDGTYATFAAVYDHEKLWTDANGTLVDSWADRVGAYYDSALYQGFFLNQLPGYDLVYNSPQIRIFKMTDAAWNATQLPANANEYVNPSS